MLKPSHQPPATPPLPPTQKNLENSENNISQKIIFNRTCRPQIWLNTGQPSFPVESPSFFWASRYIAYEIDQFEIK